MFNYLLIPISSLWLYTRPFQTYSKTIQSNLRCKIKIFSETDCGHRIVDATNKKIIQASEDDAKYTKYTQSFFSKENDQNQDEELEEMDQMEKTQIIEELD